MQTKNESGMDPAPTTRNDVVVVRSVYDAFGRGDVPAIFGLFIDDEEGHVVQIGHTRGAVHETGRPFDVPETHVWTVMDGKVLRFESYIDTARTREALGL